MAPYALLNIVKLNIPRICRYYNHGGHKIYSATPRDKTVNKYFRLKHVRLFVFCIYGLIVASDRQIY